MLATWEADKMMRSSTDGDMESVSSRISVASLGLMLVPGKSDRHVMSIEHLRNTIYVSRHASKVVLKYVENYAQ